MELLSTAVAVDSKGVSGHLRGGQVGNRFKGKYPVEDVQRQMSRVTSPYEGQGGVEDLGVSRQERPGDHGNPPENE